MAMVYACRDAGVKQAGEHQIAVLSGPEGKQAVLCDGVLGAWWSLVEEDFNYDEYGNIAWIVDDDKGKKHVVLNGVPQAGFDDIRDVEFFGHGRLIYVGERYDVRKGEFAVVDGKSKAYDNVTFVSVCGDRYAYGVKTETGNECIVVDGVAGKHYDDLNYFNWYTGKETHFSYQATRPGKRTWVVDGAEMPWVDTTVAIVKDLTWHTGPQADHFLYSLVHRDGGSDAFARVVDGIKIADYYRVEPVNWSGDHYFYRAILDEMGNERVCIIDGKVSDRYASTDSVAWSGDHYAYMAIPLEGPDDELQVVVMDGQVIGSFYRVWEVRFDESGELHCRCARVIEDLVLIPASVLTV